MDKNQAKHQRLVSLLNEHFGYNFKVNEDTEFGAVVNIDINEINTAVVLLCDVLNINSCSAGSRDLFTFLHKYLTDKNFQKKVNDIK